MVQRLCLGQLLLALAFAALLPQGGVSLRMVRVTVPPYPEVGQTIELSCQFELQGDRLYSVSWYKDFDEFYRYVPRGAPTKHVYKIEGVKVDVARSDAGRVVMMSVSLRASGLYMCEVSAEAPSFTSVHAQAWMTVIALPTENPRVCESQDMDSCLGHAWHSEGQRVSLNCTSSPSYPATQIHWYLNGDQVESQSEQVITRMNQRLSTSAVLQFQLSAQHLAPGQLIVRCVTYVPNSAYGLSYHREASFIVQGGSARTRAPFSRVLLALSLASLTS